MGTSSYFADLVMELKLVHDVQAIHAVNIKELLLKDDKSPEVPICFSFYYITAYYLFSVDTGLYELFV